MVCWRCTSFLGPPCRMVGAQSFCALLTLPVDCIGKHVFGTRAQFSSWAVWCGLSDQEKYTCTRLCVHPSEPRFLAQTQGDYIAEFSTLPPYRINKCKRFEAHKVCVWCIRLLLLALTVHVLSLTYATVKIILGVRISLILVNIAWWQQMIGVYAWHVLASSHYTPCPKKTPLYNF